MWYGAPRSKSAHCDGQDILIDTNVESRFTKIPNQHYALPSQLTQHSTSFYHTDRPLCQHHFLHIPGKILPTSERFPSYPSFSWPAYSCKLINKRQSIPAWWICKATKVMCLLYLQSDHMNFTAHERSVPISPTILVKGRWFPNNIIQITILHR
jgi:hypothetical protein